MIQGPGWLGRSALIRTTEKGQTTSLGVAGQEILLILVHGQLVKELERLWANRETAATRVRQWPRRHALPEGFVVTSNPCSLWSRSTRFHSGSNGWLRRSSSLVE